MKKIIYTRADDGGLDVIIPNSKSAIERVLGPLTDVEYEEHVWEHSVPGDAITPDFIDDSNIPQNREFRDEWRQDGNTIIVDQTLARVKHMDRIRFMRQKKFEEMGFPQRLNIQIESAILDDRTKTELQRLRDIPQTFDLSSAKTPEELKFLWPEGVEKHPIYK